MLNRNNSLKYGKMVEMYCPESRAKRLQNKKNWGESTRKLEGMKNWSSRKENKEIGGEENHEKIIQ